MKPILSKTLSFLTPEYIRELQDFFTSISFSRAIRIGIAVSLPAVIGLQTGHVEIGMIVSFGAFWSSPSDIVGSFKHKKIGILVSTILAMVISFIKGYLYLNVWLLLPVLGILTFAISYISIFGFRASLVSFSGLIALVLSSAHNFQALEVYQYALLIGAGGLWYLVLTKIWYRTNPRAESEGSLAETYFLTAEFLEIRGKLVDPNLDHDKLQAELIDQQSKLTANHETLREILTQSRRASGWSTYQSKRLLVFVQLVEMLETAIANPGNYKLMDTVFQNHPQFIDKFQDLIFEMAYQLRMVAIAGNKLENLPDDKKMEQSLDEIQHEIELLRDELFYEDYLMLQNLLEYQETQYRKLKRIKWLFDDQNTSDADYIDQKSARRFLSTQNYDPILLLRNFSFKSTIFRHSIRLAFTVMVGYAIGSLIDVQNAYSILLIVIVVMRPSYGLTRSRAKDRLIGTFIGGALAVSVVLLIQNPYFFGVMGVISLVIALSLLQKNYKASSAFITLSVVFIYANLSPDILSVIKFRILDTIVGAALSYIAIQYLWPSWEYIEIKDSIEKSVKANKEFFNQIINIYQQKGKISTTYNLARKQAFLESSNLNSAFQRMAQEPKSKQKEMDSIYELVVLNHTFLTSLASLSSYIQENKTTEASEQFKNASIKINQNLDRLILFLVNLKELSESEENNSASTFEKHLPTFNLMEFKSLLTKDEDKEAIRNMQEAHLVWEQIQWLYSISGKMLKTTSTINLT